MEWNKYPWINIIAGIIGAIIIIFQTIESPKLNWKKQKPKLIILLSVVLMIVSTFGTIKNETDRNAQIKIDSIRADKISKSIDSSLIKADSLKIKVDTITNTIIVVDKKADSQLIKINQYSTSLKQIFDQQESNMKSLTGGDGFAFLVPEMNNKDSTKSEFRLVRGGSYDLIGLGMVYYPNNGKEILEYFPYYYYSSKTFNFSYFKNSFPEELSFSALNGKWDQRIIYYKKDGVWEYCYYVLSDTHPKGNKPFILKRYTSKNFPKDKLNEYYEKIWAKQTVN